MHTSSTARASISAGIATTTWGIGGICSNIIFNTTDASPTWLVGMRMLWAGILMLLWGLATKQDLLHVWKDRKRALRLVAFGLVGVWGAQLTYLMAIYYGNAAIATIMLSLVAAMIVILNVIREHTLPRPIDSIAVIAALTGVVLLVTNGDFTKLHVAPLAVFWGFLAALTGVAYTLLPRPLVQRESPTVVVGWGLLLGGVCQNFVKPFWILPHGMKLSTWAILAFVIIAATLVAYILYVSSLRTLAPATAAMIGNFEPLTATVLSVVVLGTSFHALQVVGIVVVLGAVVMMSWQPGKQKRALTRLRKQGGRAKRRPSDTNN